MTDLEMRAAAKVFARGDLRSFTLGRAYRVRHGCEYGEDCGGPLGYPCERRSAAASVVVRLHRELDYGRGRAFTVTMVRPTHEQVYQFNRSLLGVPSERWHLQPAFILARDLEDVPEREAKVVWACHNRDCEFCHAAH